MMRLQLRDESFCELPELRLPPPYERRRSWPIVRAAIFNRWSGGILAIGVGMLMLGGDGLGIAGNALVGGLEELVLIVQAP